MNKGSPVTDMNAASHPLTPKVSTEVQVMFFDTDCAAVVHNIAYLRFIETARTHLAEKLGMALLEMVQSQLFPVVARTEIDYKKPARLGDKLIISGWLDSFDRSRFWCAFEIHREGETTPLVTSRQMLALVQMPAGRPVRMPSEWSSQYPHLCPSLSP